MKNKILGVNEWSNKWIGIQINEYSVYNYHFVTSLKLDKFSVGCNIDDQGYM